MANEVVKSPEIADITNPFNAYIESIGGELKDMFKKTFSPLRDDPVLIKEDLIFLVGYLGRVNAILPRLNYFNAVATRLFLPPKDKLKSELDREAILEDDAKEFIYWRSFVKGLEETISKRISVGQSILKSYANEEKAN